MSLWISRARYHIGGLRATISAQTETAVRLSYLGCQGVYFRLLGYLGDGGGAFGLSERLGEGSWDSNTEVNQLQSGSVHLRPDVLGFPCSWSLSRSPLREDSDGA